MSNIFNSLKLEIEKPDQVITGKDILLKIKGKNFNSQLRQELEDSSVTNDNISYIIKIICNSNEPDLLLLTSLLYTKIGKFQDALKYAFAGHKDDNNPDSRYLYANAAIDRFIELLEKSEFLEAKETIDYVYRRFRRIDSQITNHFHSFSKLIPVYSSFDEKVSGLDKKFEIQQWRLIEILGIFSAVLAFIITNIQIATKNLNLGPMLVLMIAMACILLLFSISLSYLFTLKEKTRNYFDFIKDKKFLATVIILLLLMYIFYISNTYVYTA